MKFGKSLLLALCLALTFLTSACTTRSPAVDLFETFKGHISNKKYDAAYNMLAETGRPATVDEFRKGMEGEWGIWFSEKGGLRQIQAVGGNSNHIAGDLVVAADDNPEARKSQGGFEVFRKDEKGAWKINWKLGTKAPVTVSSRTVAEAN